MNGEIPDPYDEPREPPNKLMEERMNELDQTTASTVDVHSTGGFVVMLTARDNQFWSDTDTALREHGYQVQKHLEGTLYVEKAPTERDLERRAEAEKERALAELRENSETP
jgi:hypothetical protein